MCSLCAAYYTYAFSFPFLSFSAEAPKPTVHIADRQAHGEARTLAFAAEHNIPLSKVPDLVEYAKEMSKDPKALDKISMGRTSASYKLRLGYVTKKRLVLDMQMYPLSPERR